MTDSFRVQQTERCWRCGLVTQDPNSTAVGYCDWCCTFRDDPTRLIGPEVWELQPDRSIQPTHPALLGNVNSTGRVGVAYSLLRLKDVGAALITSFVAVDSWRRSRRPLVFLTQLGMMDTGCMFDEYEARYSDYDAAVAGHAAALARLQAFGAALVDP